MPRTVRPKAKGPAKPTRPAHRPTKFTSELGEKICELIACGWLMKDAARHFGIAPETACRWRLKHADFREAYTLARVLRTEVWAEECIEIADDASRDHTIDKHGHLIFDSENVHRARLRIDARKWQMARLDPRLWGDRQQIDVKDDLALMTPDERERKALQLLDMLDAWPDQKRKQNAAIEEIKYDPGEPGDLNPAFRPKKGARPEPATIDQTSPNE